MCVSVSVEITNLSIHTGLLPTPSSGPVSADGTHSPQGSSQPTSKSKMSTKSPPRSRPIPKSYKVSPPSSPPPLPVSSNDSSKALRVPAPSSSRSVSPLATHAQSARDSTPPPKSAPSPIHWQGSHHSEESGSESRTPSPLHKGHTPRAYRPIISPIILSEGSDTGRSPSPLSLVWRENGIQVCSFLLPLTLLFPPLSSSLFHSPLSSPLLPPLSPSLLSSFLNITHLPIPSGETKR